jgi:general secretion pathway protein E
METRRIQDFEPLPAGDIQYPVAYMENNLAILLKSTDQVRIIGVCEPDVSDTVEQLKLYHSQDTPRPDIIDFVRIEKADLLGFIARISTEASTGRDSRLGRLDQLSLDQLANDAPIINLVNSRILQGFSQRASDIHFESLRNEVQIRYRIDGVLRTAETLERSLFPAISSRLKLMANLNIMERRLPQDGRFTVEFEKESVDIRISIVPTSRGESIVLRLFQKKNALLGLEELGLNPEQLEAVRRQYKSPHGLILVSGPTGSGKTTTLNAILRELNTEEVKIITIEDPVEYAIEGIDQIQTHEEIGLSFNSLLRRILRQDPDIIMVGEIRDGETAELAVRAALTGHLVLSTVHTNSAASTVQRLVNMGVPSYLLAAVLRAAVAQRLVRRICDSCKEPYEPDAHELAMFRAINSAPPQLYRGRGCQTCGNSGYQGRIALTEILENSLEVERHILDEKDTHSIENAAAEQGFKLLIMDGLEKAASGLTTLDEVQRVLFS